MAKINFKDISTSGFDEDVLTTATSGERAQAAPRARPRRSRLEFRPSRTGKLRRLARAQASGPTHEVRRLAVSQTIVR